MFLLHNLEATTNYVSLPIGILILNIKPIVITCIKGLVTLFYHICFFAAKPLSSFQEFKKTSLFPYLEYITTSLRP